MIGGRFPKSLATKLGMGRLIAVHGIRGFKAHGSVHRHQFAYRVFFSILINAKWHIVIA